MFPLTLWTNLVIDFFGTYYLHIVCVLKQSFIFFFENKISFCESYPYGWTRIRYKKVLKWCCGAEMVLRWCSGAEMVPGWCCGAEGSKPAISPLGIRQISTKLVWFVPRLIFILHLSNLIGIKTDKWHIILFVSYILINNYLSIYIDPSDEEEPREINYLFSTTVESEWLEKPSLNDSCTIFLEYRTLPGEDTGIE